MDWRSHLDSLETVFKWLAEANLTLNLVKCKLAQATITYLGKQVGYGQVRPLEEKVTAIVQCSPPKTRRWLKRRSSLEDAYHTTANHQAEFRPWRRDLNFKGSPAKLVRRLALPLCSKLSSRSGQGIWVCAYISHHVAAQCIDTLGEREGGTDLKDMDLCQHISYMPHIIQTQPRGKNAWTHSLSHLPWGSQTLHADPAAATTPALLLSAGPGHYTA
ncbi:hypothetical protein SRHO_G00133680 [Serrasalmus rhombeus]